MESGHGLFIVDGDHGPIYNYLYVYACVYCMYACMLVFTVCMQCQYSIRPSYVLLYNAKYMLIDNMFVMCNVISCVQNYVIVDY